MGSGEVAAITSAAAIPIAAKLKSFQHLEDQTMPTIAFILQVSL
jgi:hypothetical protein